MNGDLTYTVRRDEEADSWDVMLPGTGHDLIHESYDNEAEAIEEASRMTQEAIDEAKAEAEAERVEAESNDLWTRITDRLNGMDVDALRRLAKQLGV